MSPPTARFCASCGTPAVPAASHCARCGAVLALQSPTGAVRAAAAEPGRSSVPSLLAGVAACTVGGFFFLVCGGILAAIAIPNFMKAQSQSKSQGAQANLRALWAAEEAWARAHDGEFLEFYVDAETPDDENLHRLRVDLGELHYAYEGMYDTDDVFVIAAYGNIDEDESEDEWELFSDDPIPFHVYDDLTERDNYRYYDRNQAESYSSAAEDDDDDDEVGGGVVGGVLGGLGTGGGDPAVEAKSATARENLRTIWEGQQAYRLKKKRFMAFDKGSGATWTALGFDALPEDANHTYSASVSGDTLTLTATGNLDADEFTDGWTLSSTDGIPMQVRSDSYNLDLSKLLDDIAAQKKELDE